MSIKGNQSAARRIGTAVLALAAAVALTSGCSLIPKEEEVLKPPMVKPQKETYDVYEVAKGKIVRQVKGTGFFESTASKYEEFQVGGKITEVLAENGKSVKKGDVLMRLDADGLDLTVKEREVDLEKAKLALDKAKESHDAQQMKIALLQQEIAQQKLDDARSQLDGRTLRAEMDGAITFVENVKIGDQAQLNKTYVKIDDPKELRVVYSVSNPNDVQDVQVGMPVEVTFRGEKLTGKVVQTPANAPKTDNKQLADKYAKTLYIAIDKLPQQAEIGSTCDIVIVTQTKDNVIKIPTKYLGSYLGRNFVKVLDGESIKEIDVEKGLESTSPAEVEIVQGLKEGQKVIAQQ